jgi:integrase
MSAAVAYRQTAVSHAFRDAADAVGLRVRLYDLRHAYAATLLGAGVPLKVVSESLGHSSIALTADVSVHVTPELRRGPPTRWTGRSRAVRSERRA